MRNIPAPLLAHLQQSVTTTCRLLKISLTNGDSYGMTSLDHAITYDGTVYSAINGFDPSIIATDAGFAVDNSEGYALLSADIPGITRDMVRRGELDGASWEMLMINYRDTTMGHIVLDAGDVGEVRLVGDSVFMPELVSYAMRLRQSIGHSDSLKCRAIFGTPHASQLGCGVDAEPLWENGEVQSVGAEEKRSFVGDDTYTEGGEILIFEPLPFPIQVGDTYRIRPDCAKTLIACREIWDNHMNYKGEPLIPIGEGSSVPDYNPGPNEIGGWDLVHEIVRRVDEIRAWLNGQPSGAKDPDAEELEPGIPPGRIQWLTGDNVSSRLYQVDQVIAP